MAIEELLQQAMVRTVTLTAPRSEASPGFNTYATYGKLLGTTAKLCLEYLRPFIRPDDEATICAAVDVEVGDRWENGVIVGLADRSVIAWQAGVIFRKGAAFQVYTDDIVEVAEGPIEPSNGRIPEKVVLSVVCKDPFRLKVPSFKAGGNLPFLVESTLTGAVGVGE